MPEEQIDLTDFHFKLDAALISQLKTAPIANELYQVIAQQIVAQLKEQIAAIK